jgi:hypothetical protein
LILGTKNPKKTRNQAPLPFGGGDGGGVETGGAKCQVT